MKAGKTEKEKYLEGALSIIACCPFRSERASLAGIQAPQVTPQSIYAERVRHWHRFPREVVDPHLWKYSRSGRMRLGATGFSGFWTKFWTLQEGTGF